MASNGWMLEPTGVLAKHLAVPGSKVSLSDPDPAVLHAPSHTFGCRGYDPTILAMAHRTAHLV